MISKRRAGRVSACEGNWIGGRFRGTRWTLRKRLFRDERGGYKGEFFSAERMDDGREYDLRGVHGGGAVHVAEFDAERRFFSGADDPADFYVGESAGVGDADVVGAADGGGGFGGGASGRFGDSPRGVEVDINFLGGIGGHRVGVSRGDYGAVAGIECE